MAGIVAGEGERRHRGACRQGSCPGLHEGPGYHVGRGGIHRC